MGQKVPGPPTRYSPIKEYPPLKFQKRIAPRKYTTSKFSSPSKIRGVNTLPDQTMEGRMIDFMDEAQTYNECSNFCSGSFSSSIVCTPSNSRGGGG